MSTYDAKEISVEVAGQILSGFEDGDFVSVVYNNDLWTTKVGADGEGVQSRSNDLSAQMTISVLPTSPANVAMQALMEDLVLKGAFPASVIDPNTLTSHVGEKWRIKKHPDRSYGKEAGVVAWVLETIRCITEHGQSPENL